MICTKCNLNLAKCSCPDLEERFRALQKTPYLSIGIEYQARILAHIEERKKLAKIQLSTEKPAMPAHSPAPSQG